MLEKYIRTSQQMNIAIRSSDQDLVDYFNHGENCTDIILRQINDERMYDPIFQGRNNMTVVDLGANIGLFSLYAHDSASRLIAVEPASVTFGLLEKITDKLPNITRVNAALNGADEPVTFFINENPTTNSLLDRSGQPTTVQGVTLKTLFENNNIDNVDFCKCDIEGSEMTAITESTLDAVKDIVKFWFVEVHQTNVKEQAWPGNLENNRQTLAAIFKNAGYNVESVINDQLYAWK